MAEHDQALEAAIVAAGFDPRNPAVREAWQAGIAAYLDARNGEAVAWLAKSRWDRMTAAEPWLTSTVYSEDQSEYFQCTPLFAAPVSAGGEKVKERDRCASIAADEAVGVEDGEYWIALRIRNRILDPSDDPSASDEAGERSEPAPGSEGSDMVTLTADEGCKPSSAPSAGREKVKETDEVAWCQPNYGGKVHPRKFMVVYEDSEMGSAIFDDEAEAREHFEKASIAWNCYLFGLLPSVPSQFLLDVQGKGWQPIETMPREDGLIVEIRKTERIETWNAMRFLRSHGDDGYTWRLPLPTAPAIRQGDEERDG